jgi:hypothetical protein
MENFYRKTILTLSGVLLFTGLSGAQNLSPVLEAINELERKLIGMIQKEQSERVQADKKIRKEFNGDQQPEALDAALAKTVEELKSTLLDVRSSQKKLNKKLGALSDSLVSLSARGEDERVREMAAGLQKLLGELKTTLETNGEAQEAMELGGIITLDVGLETSDAADIAAEIGEVNLSAVVNLADGLTAFIALLAEGDMAAISIDEAMIEWALLDEKLVLVGGQHAFYHGLLSTHLISDPLMLDNVELIAPGATTAFRFKTISCALGAAYIHNDAETENTYIIDGTDITVEETVLSPEENYFAGVTTIDYNFLEESTARMSALFYLETVSIATGCGVVLGPVSLDLEWFGDIENYESMQASGLYGGIAVAPADAFEAAFRYDLMTPDAFNDLEHRFGIGASFGLPHDLFIALEYGYNLDSEGNGTGKVAFQFGLESTVKLPGFQRKTLTRK